MGPGPCGLFLALAATMTESWAIYSPAGDAGCVASDNIASEVVSALQTSVALERQLASSGGKRETSQPATQSGRSKIVLHMHFNYQRYAKNVLWLLEETRLCHPDNFLACLFVSDWDNASLPVLDKARHGEKTGFFNCPANRGVKVSPSGETWWAFYVHTCVAQSLQWAKSMAGADGVLVLADDTVITRPWKALAVDLQNHGGIVVPGIQQPDLKLDTNLLNSSTWPSPTLDKWFWEGDGLASNPSRLLAALNAFQPEEKQRLGMTSLTAPVFKSSADAIYVPLSRAAEFERLSNVFSHFGIYYEYAVPIIARAIEGQHALLGQKEAVLLRSLWGVEERKDPWAIIKNVRLLQTDGSAGVAGNSAPPCNSTCRTAFVHPVKLGVKGADGTSNKVHLKALYDVIFA